MLSSTILFNLCAVAGFAPLQIIFFIRLKQYGEQSVRRYWNRDQAACDTDHKHRTQGVGKNFECDIHMHASFGRRITTLTHSVAGVKRLAVLPRCFSCVVALRGFCLWCGCGLWGFRFALPVLSAFGFAVGTLLRVCLGGFTL